MKNVAFYPDYQFSYQVRVESQGQGIVVSVASSIIS